MADSTKQVKMGRPTKYTTELAQEIFDRVSDGEALTRICKDDHMPVYTTVVRWKIHNNDFCTMYAKAKELQAETHEDRMLEIARTEPDVQRAKLIVDTMKWAAVKLNPKKFGDRTQTDITTGDQPLSGLQVPQERIQEFAAFLAQDMKQQR